MFIPAISENATDVLQSEDVWSRIACARARMASKFKLRLSGIGMHGVLAYFDLPERGRMYRVV